MSVFTQILIAIPAFLVVITVLVAVHEFGHYWVAKKLNIKVERFSIGFGKPLWKKIFKGNETEFVIASLPLGGYVKMLDERVTEDISEQDLPRAFNRQSPWKRIAVLLGGPLINLIFAILVFWILFIYGVSAYKPLLQPIDNTPAQLAGLKAGDQVIAVSEKTVNSFEDFITSLFDVVLDGPKEIGLDGTVNLQVIRNGEKERISLLIPSHVYELTKPQNMLTELGISNWQPPIPAQIDQISSNSPAEEAGLQRLDTIVQLDGVNINSWQQLVTIIRDSAGQTLPINYQRDTRQMQSVINVGEQLSGETKIGIIGVSVAVPDEYGKELQTKQQYGPFKAFGKATQKTWDLCVLSLKMFKEMVKGNVSLKNLSGPVSIAEQAGYSVQLGFERYIAFFALISIALGIVNLLPIPMLDGGQIVLNAVELGKGSPVSERIELIYQQFGFLCIVLLMGLAIFNDIERLVN